MIVLDTTVLVYAKGADHPLRDPCRRLIEACAAGQVEATTSVEAIQEFVHVRARRRDHGDAAGLGRDYAELLSPLLQVGAEQLRRGLALFEEVEELGAFDAVLAAAALDLGATALISADEDFAAVPGLPHARPDAAGVERLLDESGA
ncbi:MAG TPA: type II toxin-antitoxin system VapC family toxin [Solirubrobacterales bacterium]|nr:type II toxin-antitoxin system VapC family toxin [Solirubrobacterales bacterium]